jgi:glutathione S-transferase
MITFNGALESAAKLNKRTTIMKLYGRYLSPFVRRVAVSLNVMQQPFEQVVLAPFDEWEKAQSINPVVRIPALEIDNGEVLIDSGAILDHLDEVAGPNSLLPRSGQPRREAMKLVATAVGAMEKTVGAVYEGRFHAPEKIEASWVERCENQALSALKALDSVAAKTNGEGWLFGDKISQADISAVVALTFANLARPQMKASDQVPSLSKLASRLEQTEAFKSTMP